MIGCAMLRLIDLRCRQGTGIDEPFGGLYCYFLGDYRQLPSVKDTPMYGLPNEDDEYAPDGKLLVSTFEKVFVLSTCFRQEDQQFLNILDNLSTGNSTKADYDILSKRFKMNVKDQDEFQDALHLFATKAEVFQFNYEKLQNLQDISTKLPVPVAKIIGQHNCKTALASKPDDADGLQSVLYIANGCNIMLRNNLWVEKGLVNGTVGKVVDVIYNNDEAAPNSFPAVIICKFPTYTGPGLGPENLIPIPSISKSWSSNSVNCTRRQFPLSVAYACSIYKSQGMTLDKVN